MGIVRDGLPKVTGEHGPKPKVVVIGAGIAGLAASRELLRAGYDVTILERTQRAGGRILTLREPFTENLFGEAGAMRIPPVRADMVRRRIANSSEAIQVAAIVISEFYEFALCLIALFLSASVATCVDLAPPQLSTGTLPRARVRSQGRLGYPHGYVPKRCSLEIPLS